MKPTKRLEAALDTVESSRRAHISQAKAAEERRNPRVAQAEYSAAEALAKALRHIHAAIGSEYQDDADAYVHHQTEAARAGIAASLAADTVERAWRTAYEDVCRAAGDQAAMGWTAPRLPELLRETY